MELSLIYDRGQVSRWTCRIKIRFFFQCLWKSETTGRHASAFHIRCEHFRSFRGSVNITNCLRARINENIRPVSFPFCLYLTRFWGMISTPKTRNDTTSYQTYGCIYRLWTHFRVNTCIYQAIYQWDRTDINKTRKSWNKGEKTAGPLTVCTSNTKRENSFYPSRPSLLNYLPVMNKCTDTNCTVWKRWSNLNWWDEIKRMTASKTGLCINS